MTRPRWPVRVAVWGCGWAGARHAAAYAAAGAEVLWCLDRDEQRARALADQHPGARTARHFDAVRGIEAISICLPHRLHAAAVVAASRAGLHVLCEKPLAPTLREADEALAAAENAGTVLQVVENQAYDPVFARVAELLDTIGPVHLAEVHREADLAGAFGERRGFLEPGGGILLSGAVHDIGTLRRLLGEIAAVEALAPANRIPQMSDEDTAVVLLRFANGAAAVLVESFVTPTPQTAGGNAEIQTLRLVGAEAILELSADRRLRRVDRLGERREEVPEADTYAALVREFLHAASIGIPFVTQAAEHRRTLAVALAAQRSTRRARTSM